MTLRRKIFCVLLAALLSALCVGSAHCGLGRCAICPCEGFAGGPTSNWHCTVCAHHWDQHYNNKKGPKGGM